MLGLEAWYLSSLYWVQLRDVFFFLLWQLVHIQIIFLAISLWQITKSIKNFSSPLLLTTGFWQLFNFSHQICHISFLIHYNLSFNSLNKSRFMLSKHSWIIYDDMTKRNIPSKTGLFIANKTCFKIVLVSWTIVFTIY